jgi:hypothetical protein
LKLLTAHKILISSAVVFFIFFGFWEFRHSGGWTIWRGWLYLIVAAAFAVYLKNFKRWYK